MADTPKGELQPLRLLKEPAKIGSQIFYVGTPESAVIAAAQERYRIYKSYLDEDDD